MRLHMDWSQVSHWVTWYVFRVKQVDLAFQKRNMHKAVCRKELSHHIEVKDPIFWKNSLHQCFLSMLCVSSLCQRLWMLVIDVGVKILVLCLNLRGQNHIASSYYASTWNSLTQLKIKLCVWHFPGRHEELNSLSISVLELFENTILLNSVNMLIRAHMLITSSKKLGNLGLTCAVMLWCLRDRTAESFNNVWTTIISPWLFCIKLSSMYF